MLLQVRTFHYLLCSHLVKSKQRIFLLESQKLLNNQLRSKAHYLTENLQTVSRSTFTPKFQADLLMLYIVADPQAKSPLSSC